MILITYHVGLDSHDPDLGYLRCEHTHTGDVFERQLGGGRNPDALAACAAWLDGRAGAYCLMDGLADPCFSKLKTWLPHRHTPWFDFPTLLAMMPEGRPRGPRWQRRAIDYWESLTGVALGTRTHENWCAKRPPESA